MKRKDIVGVALLVGLIAVWLWVATVLGAGS